MSAEYVPLYIRKNPRNHCANGEKLSGTVPKFRDSSYIEATRAASNMGREGVGVPPLHGSHASFLSNYRVRHEKVPHCSQVS